MEGNDLSNEIAPRLLFVFENTIAYLPSESPAAAKERIYLKFHRWDRAVACWDIPGRSHALLWDLAWRHNYRFDVITYKPVPFSHCLRLRLEDEGVPFSNLWATTPGEMARRMAYMPDVAQVFDSDPDRRFTYGDRGRLLPGGLATVSSLW